MLSTQHGLVRPIAGVGPVQQRHMSRLAHQSRQSDHPQIAAFALGVAAARQFPRCGGGDMRVKVGRVERQHVGRQLEAPNDRTGDLNLRLLQLCIRDLGGQAVKRLPGELEGWQTRHARGTHDSRKAARWHLPVGTQACCTATASTISTRRTALRGLQTTGLINKLDQIQLLSDPH